MRLKALTIGMTALLAVVGAADAASAQSRSRASALSLSEADAAQSAQSQRRLQWNPSGRWGLDLNVRQESRDSNEVEAGAYYRVTPSLRVGASAGVGVTEADPASPRETDRRGQPRLRLESIFRF